MRILEQRFLRGPNLHADTPCLLSVLDLQALYGVASNDLPGFSDALLALMPSLEGYALPTGQLGGFGQRLREGTYLARVVEQVTLDLQCQAGAPASYGRTRPVTGHPGQFRVVCAYQLENVVAPAFRMAVELVVALSRGETFDLAPRLAQLRATARQFAIDPSTAAILSAAHERGIPTQRLAEEANLFQLGWGSKQQRLQDTLTGAASHIAVRIAGDRRLSMALLREAGIPVPEGEAATTVESAQGAARRLGFPVTVKPLQANPLDVAVECANAAQVAQAFADADAAGSGIIVEQSVAGKSFRVLVAGGRIAAAAWRRPAQVQGDGVHTIGQLVERENRNPLRSADHVNILSAIPLDAHADAVLAQQGLTLASVAPAGQAVRLRARANLATGGTVEDVTDRLPTSTRRLCVRTAATIGLDVVGIDIVCADIGAPLKAQGGAIVAVTAIQIVGALAAGQAIEPAATDQHVVTTLPEQDIVPGIAVEPVGAGPAVEIVGPLTAGQAVPAIAAQQRIVAAEAEQRIIAGATAEAIGIGTARQGNAGRRDLPRGTRLGRIPRGEEATVDARRAQRRQRDHVEAGRIVEAGKCRPGR